MYVAQQSRIAKSARMCRQPEGESGGTKANDLNVTTPDCVAAFWISTAAIEILQRMAVLTELHTAQNRGRRAQEKF